MKKQNKIFFIQIRIQILLIFNGKFWVTHKYFSRCMQEYQVRGELREEQRGRGGETIQGAARDPGGIHPGTPSQSSHKKKFKKVDSDVYGFCTKGTVSFS